MGEINSENSTCWSWDKCVETGTKRLRNILVALSTHHTSHIFSPLFPKLQISVGVLSLSQCEDMLIICQTRSHKQVSCFTTPYGSFARVEKFLTAATNSVRSPDGSDPPFNITTTKPLEAISASSPSS